MIEKIKEIKSTRRVHEIYCDRCHKKIMESEELDDGFYDTPYPLEIGVYIDGWIRYSKCLCECCKKEEKEQLINNLINIGFVKD